MNIGENLKSIRKNKGLTQSEFGNLVGLSEITIRRYEKGERTPTMEVISQIAEALNISVNELITEEHNLNPINKNFYKNKSDEEIISLLKHQGFKDDVYLKLSNEEKDEFLDRLSNIYPLKLKLSNCLSNINNLKKEDLIDFYNTVQDYIKVVINETYEPLRKDYLELRNTCIAQSEIIKIKDDYIKKLEESLQAIFNKNDEIKSKNNKKD